MKKILSRILALAISAALVSSPIANSAQNELQVESSRKGGMVQEKKLKAKKAKKAKAEAEERKADAKERIPAVDAGGIDKPFKP